MVNLTRIYTRTGDAGETRLGDMSLTTKNDLRLHAYAEKAMREAGDRTTWTDPDEEFEAAVHAAVDAAFDDPAVAGLVTDLVARLADAGWSNALSAKLVAITAPGVCDVYQGSELWETSLVDPDNRRPVDFEHRAAVLAGTEEDDAAAKLHVTCSALTLRPRSTSPDGASPRTRPDDPSACSLGAPLSHVLRRADKGPVETEAPATVVALGIGKPSISAPPLDVDGAPGAD